MQPVSAKTNPFFEKTNLSGIFSAVKTIFITPGPLAAKDFFFVKLPPLNSVFIELHKQSKQSPHPQVAHASVSPPNDRLPSR
jgi:hypothetical protein